MNHRLNFTQLCSLDELHNSELTLPINRDLTQTLKGIVHTKVSIQNWKQSHVCEDRRPHVYLLQLFGAPLDLPDHPLHCVHTHAGGRLGETLPARWTPWACSAHRSPTLGGGRRWAGRGLIQHKPVDGIRINHTSQEGFWSTPLCRSSPNP